MDKKSFNILYEIFKGSLNISEERLNGNAYINNLVNLLESQDLIKGGQITESGIEKLKHYRVDNAIIMAAGLSSRFAPLSYETPKGLLMVKGEVLIERQIRQLKEAGIKNITVVTGYKKEKFEYLKEKLDVEILVNEEFNKRNNNSTLYLVRDKLKNSYICSSDNYFTKNVFESHVYDSYYSVVYQSGDTDEYCVKLDEEGIIQDVKVGGVNSLAMLGHVYFSNEFSKKFVDILVEDYNKPNVDGMLWEDIYINHIKDLQMYAREYSKEDVLEFDYLEDLRAFDENYINNTGSQIIRNICSVLNCEEKDVVKISPVKKGLTNTSFLFTVKGKKYVYRHPGEGTEEIINRASEAYSQKVAKELSLDDTFIYMSSEEGWKVSHFLEECIDFDYKNPQHVKEGLALVKKLHDACIKSTCEFNIFNETEKLLKLVVESGYLSDICELISVRDRIARLYECADGDGIEKRLCHNDCYDPNFLTDGKKMYLIDWEYSGNADPASDMGTFICCSDYTVDEALEVLKVYFGRELTEIEKRHYLAYVSISSYYWYVWALYKESLGEDVGEYLNLWHDYAIKYHDISIKLY